MPIKLDLAGLNSLIYENVTSSTNTIGGNLVAIGDKSESLASLETTTVSNAYLRGPVYSNALRMPNTLTEQEAFLSQTGSTVTGYSTTGGFSLTTWLKLDAAAHISEGTADTRTLFAAYGTGSVNNDFSFKIEITGSDLRVNVYQSGSLSSKVATYTSTVNTTNLSNDWHHIGFTFNGNLSDATGGTIYLNAVSQSLTYAAAGGVAGTSRKDFKNIYLFDRGRAQTTNELQGAMQELATWNTTLSLTNIQDVSASTNLNSLGIAGNMIDYWKLGEEPALNQYAWEQPDSLPASTVIASSLTSPNNNLTASVGFKFSQGRYIVGNPFTSYTVAGGFSYSFWARLPAETSVEERRVWRGSSVSQYAAFSGTNFRAVFQGTSQFFHQWDISDINQQEWNHYVLTWRGDFAESPALYVNKQFKGFGVFILPHPGATDVPDSIDSLYVLDDPKGGTDRELKGELQDLAFYGKELSTSEVSELYGIGIIRPDYSSLSFQASILDYWSFGDETELNSYSVDQTIPNGTTVRSTLGHQNYLTVKENIVKKNGHFQPYYNIMNIGLNAAVDPRAHLAALNIHRGGLYGYSTFKQVRSSQNPLSRLHKANSIFSYVKEGGDYIQQKVGTQLVAFRERKGALTNITESAVISSHKPITLVGTTIDDDDDSTQTRVEIKASFSNENQFFGNEKANRDFGLSFDVVDDYEELTDLYLEGGLDQDFSPIEEFEVLKYSQTIFPKAGNSYLDEVRTRKNYTNTFWRDLRTNRTQVGTINNNFGFTIPSQSLWPLDVEQNWAARSFGATVGSFTIQTPCSLAFNMTSASADGIEFSNADIHIWNEQAQATAPGTDTGFVADDTSAPFDFKIRGERFSFNSKEGNERFWDGWALALRDAGFSSVSHTPNAFDLRSGYSAERFNNPVSDKYYLQVNPLSFNEANWKSDFNFMMLYFWFRNLSATTKGYLYREVDSDGNNRRSVYFDGNQIQVQVSTVFESLDEDRNATAPITASTIEDGAVRRDLTIPPTPDIWQSGSQTGGAAIGREFNNVQIVMNNSSGVQNINDIAFKVNDNTNASLGTTTQDSCNFYSGGILLNDGTSKAYRLADGYLGVLKSTEKLDELTPSRALDFNNGVDNNAGQAVFNFSLKGDVLGFVGGLTGADSDMAKATQADSFAQTIFYGDSKPRAGYSTDPSDEQHRRNYIWIYMKNSLGSVSDGEGGTTVTPPARHLYVQMGVQYRKAGPQDALAHGLAIFDLTDYIKTDQFVQISVVITGAEPTGLGAPNHEILCKVGVNGQATPTTLTPLLELGGELKNRDNNGDGIKDGIGLFAKSPSQNFFPITRYSLFGLCGIAGDSAAMDFQSRGIGNIGFGNFEGDHLAIFYSADGGQNRRVINDGGTYTQSRMGDVKYAGHLVDYALDQFAIVKSGGLSPRNADRNLIFNFTGSAYPAASDVLAWYKLGEGSDPSRINPILSFRNYVEDVGSGGHTDLNLSASYTDIVGNLGVLSAAPAIQRTNPPVFSGDFLFNKIDGMYNVIKSPVYYHTSSVSEVYVMCKTGSGNNSSDDYLHDLTASAVALFQGSDASTIPSLSPKYCWQDLTSSAFSSVEPKIWYTFDNSGLDEIKLTGSFIANSGTLRPNYNLTGTYTEGVNRGQFVEGPVVDGSSNFSFKATQPAQGQGTNQSFGSGISSFVASTLSDLEAAENFYLGGSNNASGGAGILMNSYNSFNASHTDTALTLDEQLYAGPSYSRRHSLRKAETFGNPYGISTTIGFPRDLQLNELFQGMAFWDCGTQAATNPFYDTYSDFIKDEKLIAKDHTIIPEFRLSSHIDKYLKTGDTDFSNTDNSLFEMLGGATNASGSNNSQFYEIYSTTDFLKNFEIIQSDHKGFVDPLSLTLKCKAIKKFLPYDGFYPAERTVNIAEQFYSSYAEHITVSSSFSDTTGSLYAKQFLLNPLFSPGILFNTIKSGIACDYPIMTGSFTTASVDYDGSITGSYYINQQFDRRIPFEALIEPEKYIANVSLGSQEADPRGTVDANASWNGQGDQKYKLMVSNFLAEVGDFFLENEDFATIASLPEGDPNFGNAQAGRTYMMRLRMFRSTSGSKHFWTQDGSTYIDSAQSLRAQGSRIAVPQDTGSADFRENFTMYSRPSAFGPPQRINLSSDANLTLKFENWSDFKFTNSRNTFYHPQDSVDVAAANNPVSPANGSTFQDLQVDTSGHFLIGSDASEGYNYPFTPPYYHGEGWADFTFVATESKKYSLNEILASSSVEFLRYYEPIPTSSVNGTFTNWRLVNEEAMQLASSMNLKSRGILGQDFQSDNVADSYRWVIQSKFETPTLNFNKYNYVGPDNKITLPNIAPEATPIGMWHQYGELPQSSNQGIFVELTEVPNNWIKNAMGGIPSRTGSLAQLCGFSSERTRVGEIKSTKRVREAVVAVPFVDNNGERQFFNIPREDIENSLSKDRRNLVGNTVNNMVDNMKDFVFPPSMDFLKNKDIDPFAMYIFVFEHTFTKQDLANIWQNISPDLGVSSEEAESTISHELLNQELLGAGAELRSGVNKKQDLNKLSRYGEIDSKIRWLVFKVKQRASTSYFEKMFTRNESKIKKTRKTTIRSTGRDSTAQYNWPYDFFSLVELVKIDADVNFAQPDDSNNESGVSIKPLVKDLKSQNIRKGSKLKRRPTIKSKKR